jgi:hypothetical protein
VTEADPQSSRQTLDSLDILVGEWSMSASFTPKADGPHARTSFEWLPGRQFLIQRWEIEHPEAPDGIAIIGFDAGKATLLQHYFDSRGIARVYEMTFANNVWTLQRLASAHDFSQRFTASFDHDTIIGRWESSSDGTNWNPDFTLTYTRVR